MTATEELKNLTEKLDNKIYFIGQDLEHGDYSNEWLYGEMKTQRNENNNLLDFTSNDPDEIEEHLSDIKNAISKTKEILNIPDYINS